LPDRPPRSLSPPWRAAALIGSLFLAVAPARAGKIASVFSEFRQNAATEIQGYPAIYRWDPKEAPDTPAEGPIEDQSNGMFLDIGIQSEGWLSKEEVIKFDFYYLPTTSNSGMKGYIGSLGDHRRTLPYFGFRELYFKQFSKSMEITIGKAPISMASSTLYTPADMVHVFGSGDPVEIQKFGVWQYSIDLFVKDDALKFAILPFNESPKLPGRQSRWLGGSGDPEFTQLPDTVSSGGLSERFYPTRPRYTGYLMKYSAIRESGDYLFSIYTGVSPYPAIARATADTALFKIPIRSMILTAGRSWTKGAWEYHMEGAYQNSYESRDQDFVRFVYGLTVRESKLANRIGLEEIRPTFEYGGEAILRGQTNSDMAATSKYARPFRNTLFSRIELVLDSTFKIVINDIYNFTENDKFFSFGVESAPNDNLTLSADFHYFEGPAQTYFGRWDRNDRFQFRFSYKL